MNIKELNFSEAINKEITFSLITSFGLDFLLFEDKQGGDVDTIHNVRQGIFATEKAKSDYENREKYNSHDYHKHKNYIAKGREDKKAHKAGELYDAYRNKTMGINEDRQLDHTKSASEISADAGRVLAGIDGADVANRDFNLNSTHWYINNLKRNHTVEKFLNEIAPQKCESLKKKILTTKEELENMPHSTPSEFDKKRRKEDELRENEGKLKVLEDALENKASMIAADQKAREAYEIEINQYYYSSKFLKSLGNESLFTGLKMGLRQAIGLMLAEVWFELKEQFPKIIKKEDFSLENLWAELKLTVKNIFSRLEKQFKNILNNFKDGFVSGFLSKISEVVINIFSTTARVVGKLIRELWSSLVNIAKLIFFNPNKLSTGQMIKEIIKLLSVGIFATLGALISTELNTIMVSMPFGSEIATFIGTLATGLMTLGITYFLEYSSLMKKIFGALDNFFKDKYDLLLEDIERINKELDEYLIELSSIELNVSLNPIEINTFTESLFLAEDERQRNMLLNAEVKKRNLDLPFESGNANSVRNWLKSKCRKN